MKSQIFTFLFLIVFKISFAQDGKIITMLSHAIEDSDKVFFQKRFKNTDSVLSQIMLEKIIYLSDKLKISGYIAQRCRTRIQRTSWLAVFFAIPVYVGNSGYGKPCGRKMNDL